MKIKSELLYMYLFLLVIWITLPLLKGNTATMYAQSIVTKIKEDINKKEIVYWGWKQLKDPAMDGWSNEKLKKAWAYAEELNSSAVMVAHKGKVVLAWGNVEFPYKCHSMRKAFLNSLYGLYTDNGIINIQKTLAELNVDDITPLTTLEKQATVEDLLQSRSGIYLRAMGDGGSMITNKPKRGEHAPGEFYYYNNWGFNALGTIFEKETGKSIFNTFKKEIAVPIGMEDFSDSLMEMQSADYTVHKYYSFRMSTRDLARFGLLYLQKGLWNGKRIISESWVERSTQSYSNTGEGGYGYLWKTFPRIESIKYGFNALSNYDIYSTTGIAVHMVAIIPELDLVFVHRFDSDNSIPSYESLPVYKLLDMIVSAKSNENEKALKYVELSSTPFIIKDTNKPKPPIVKLSDSTMSSYVGLYYKAPIFIRIKREDDHLQHLEQDNSVFDNLYPESDTRFFYESWDRKIEFVKNKEGFVTHYNLIMKGVSEKVIKVK